MKHIYRKFSLLRAGLLAVSIVAGSKGYQPDYGYTPIDPGELAAPKVSRDDPDFRKQYPTLEKYDEPVTITVAAVQYGLESDVKKGTTPF